MSVQTATGWLRINEGEKGMVFLSANMLRRLVRIITVLVVRMTPLNAHEMKDAGTIEGKVTDSKSKIPLEGATVRILGTERATTSDRSGYFEIRNITPGMYTVEIYAPGYEIILEREVRVSSEKIFLLNIELEKEYIYTLDEIVVTATRMREKVKNIEGSVSVIHKETIETMPTVHLVDIIDVSPGFQTYSADGNSMSPGVNVRGFTGGGMAEYLLVMVDGVPINDMETGLVNWNLVPAGKIERIEILRGPSSALYGDAALGGVINILTDERRGRRVTEFSIEGGSYGEYGGRLHLARTSEHAAYEMYASQLRRDGWRDRSDWRGENMTGKVRLAIGKDWKLSLSSLNQRIRSQTPGALTPAQLQEDRNQSVLDLDREDQRRHLLFLNVDREHFRRGRVEANLYFQYKDTDIYRTLFFETKEQSKETYHVRASTQYSTSLSWKGITHQLVCGAEVEWGRMHSRYFDLLSADRFSETPSTKGLGVRRKAAWYLQGKFFPVEHVSATLGLRWDGIYDDYEDELRNNSSLTSDKSALSTKLGLNWKPDEYGHLYANLGRAFKAPTIEQLFDQRPFYHEYLGTVFISNAALEAQSGINYEIGLRRSFGPLMETGLSLYQMDMEDEIEFDMGTLQYVNIGKSRHRGFEGEIRIQPFSSATGFVSYTYSDAQYRTGGNTGNQINNIPNHQMTVGLLYTSDVGFKSGILIHSVKDQYMDAENEYPLADYT
ncbi:MAG: TonB-dependent receptor, partial [Gemmatimonadota bacterium]